MIHMMLADGDIRDNEVDVIRDIYIRIAKAEISHEDLLSEAEELKHHGIGLNQDLVELSGRLNAIGKEHVIKAALSVAAADGEFQEEEKRLIADIATRLGMTPAHIKGVFQSMQSSA